MFNVYLYDYPTNSYTSIYDPEDPALTLVTPKLNLEMGKAGSFEFVALDNHRYLSRFTQLTAIVVVEYNGVEIFRGRVLTNNRDMQNNHKIYCEGLQAYLIDSVQRGEKFPGKVKQQVEVVKRGKKRIKTKLVNETGDVKTFVNKIIDRHNGRIGQANKRFVVGEIDEDLEFLPLEAGQTERKVRSLVVPGKSSETDKLESSKFDYKQVVLDSLVDKWATTKEYLEDNLIDAIGGYLRTRFDRVNKTLVLDYKYDSYGTTTQVIEFGKNLIDLTEEKPADDIFTVLIPIGDKNITVDGATYYEPNPDNPKRPIKKKYHGDEIKDEAAVAKYGRIVRTESFGGVSKKETLLENGRRFLENNLKTPTVYTVKAVDMHLLESSTQAIYVGDKVRLKSPLHGIDEMIVCTKIEYNFDDPSNTTYTFGNPEQELTVRYRKNAKGKGGGSRKAAAGGGKKKTPEETVAEGAEAAAEEVETKTDAKLKMSLDEFYDKYITFDSDGRTLTATDAVRKLGHKIGINFIDDDNNADVDIYAIHNAVDQNGKYIGQLSADVQVHADSQEAWSGLIARFSDDDKVVHEGYIKVLATKDGTTLKSLTNEIDIRASNEHAIADVLRESGLMTVKDGDGNVNGMKLYSKTSFLDEKTRLESAFESYLQTFSDTTSSWTGLFANFQEGGEVKHEGYIKVVADREGTTLESLTDTIKLQTKEHETMTSLGRALTETGLVSFKQAGSTGEGLGIYSKTTLKDEFDRVLGTMRADVQTFTDENHAWSGLVSSYTDEQGVKNEGYIKVIADRNGTTLESLTDAINLQTKEHETITSLGRALTQTGLVSFKQDGSTGEGLGIYSKTTLKDEFDRILGTMRADVQTFSDESHAWSGLVASYTNMQGVTNEGYIKVIADRAGTTLKSLTNNIDITTSNTETLKNMRDAITETGIVTKKNGKLISQFSATEIWGKVNGVDAKLGATESKFDNYSDANEAWATMSASYSDSKGVKNDAYLKVIADAQGSKIEGKANSVDLTAEVGNAKAELKMYVDSGVGQSVIELNADLTKVSGRLEAVEGNFKKLTSESGRLDRIYATHMGLDSLTVNKIVLAENGDGIYYGSAGYDVNKVPTKAWVNLQLGSYATKDSLSGYAKTSPTSASVPPANQNMIISKYLKATDDVTANKLVGRFIVKKDALTGQEFDVATENWVYLNYARKSEIPTVPNMNNYVTQNQLTYYATKSDISTFASEGSLKARTWMSSPDKPTSNFGIAVEAILRGHGLIK